jgi:hypothetical protein
MGSAPCHIYTYTYKVLLVPPDVFTQKNVTAFLAETPGHLHSFVWPNPESLCFGACMPSALHHKIVCIQHNFPHMPLFIEDY